MSKLFNLAKMTTSTTGTGAISLGTAVSGFLTFEAAGAANADVLSYGVSDGANSEVGYGTYGSAGTTLARTTILASTNSGSAIDLSGNAIVYITALAENFTPIQVDQAGGTSDTYGVLSGTRDGENTTFTVSQSAYTSGTLSVYLNGQLLTQGSSEDWQETTPASGTFDFTTAPSATDEITVVYGGSGSGGGRRHESEIVLFRNAKDYIVGPTSTTYAAPDDALSASFMRFRADMLTGASIVYAAWRLAWNPNAPGATVTGVRLIKADDGPSNIEVLATREVGSTTDPTTYDVDVTTEFQTMLSDGVSKSLGHQMRGDGSNAPHVYASWVEIIWE